MTSAPALAAGALFIALAVASPAAAGTLTLTSGERLHGRLLVSTAGQVGFLSDRFGAMAIEPLALQAYNSEGPVTLELASGERLVADQFVADATTVQAVTKFGEVRGTWSDILQAAEAEAPPTSAQASTEPSPPPPSAAPRNTLTLDVAQQGNQLSSLAGGKRTHLTSLEATYERRIGPSTSVGIAVPFYYNQVSLTDFGETTTDRRASIGDVRLSLSRTFRSQSALPHVQAGISVGLPTGSSGGPSDRSLAGFSSGVWSLGGQLGLQKTLGGGSILAAGGYTIYIPRHGGRSTDSIDWAFGYSAQVGQGWSFDTTVTGSFTRIEDMTAEPTYLSLRAHYFSGRIGVSPYVLMGLNTDAQDFKVGLSISRSW